jgi:bacterioferritin-associated ferredoxin
VPAAGDELVCICNAVPRSVIDEAIAAGAYDIAELGRVTLAGTGCGTCRGELAQLVIAAQSVASA